MSIRYLLDIRDVYSQWIIKPGNQDLSVGGVCDVYNE